MKHRHAELMMEYARDAMETDKPWERWESKFEAEDDAWLDQNGHPRWLNKSEYRRKPRSVNINGFDVPEPVRSPLENGTKYYIPSIYWDDMHVEYTWSGYSSDFKLLKKGVIHLSENAAIKHAEALLSFTMIEK